MIININHLQDKNSRHCLEVINTCEVKKHQSPKRVQIRYHALANPIKRRNKREKKKKAKQPSVHQHGRFHSIQQSLSLRQSKKDGVRANPFRPCHDVGSPGMKWALAHGTSEMRLERPPGIKWRRTQRGQI